MIPKRYLVFGFYALSNLFFITGSLIGMFYPEDGK